MRLTHLSLHNFRNYVRLDLDLPPGVSLLQGDNAQGKTNLLEAVYYLATSRSPHAGADRVEPVGRLPDLSPMADHRDDASQDVQQPACAVREHMTENLPGAPTETI